MKVRPDDAVHLGQLVLRNTPQCRDQFENAIVGKAIAYELAVPTRRDEPAATHLLQMVRGVGDGETRALGKRLDAALALGKLLQKLQSVGIGDRLRDDGQLLEDQVLWAFS